MWRGTNTSVKGTQDDLTGGEDESSIPLLSVDEMADDKSPLLPSRDVFIGSESESSSVQFGGQEKVPWWSYIWVSLHSATESLSSPENILTELRTTTQNEQKKSAGSSRNLTSRSLPFSPSATSLRT